jgi:choline dehydrogenase-like flavoprotein
VGSVRLRSADPLAAPRIRLNLLGDADGHDLRELVAALQLAASLEATARASAPMSWIICLRR